MVQGVLRLRECSAFREAFATLRMTKTEDSVSGVALWNQDNQQSKFNNRQFVLPVSATPW
jgi:hypothetical protein